MVLFGRNGESPVPVVAASSPSQCFHAAIEAARIALKYRTPVYLLSDAYARERLRAVADPGRRRAARRSRRSSRPRRTTATPSTPTCAIPRRSRARGRCRARRASSTGSAGSRRPTSPGAISYDPDNHDHMVRLRAQKVANIAADIPELEVDDPDGDARRSCSAGARRTARSAPPCGGCAARRPQGRERAPPPPEPVPAQPRRRAAPLRQGARARDEHGPAAAADPGRVPRRRRRLQPRPRAAVPLERAATRGDHDAWSEARR